VTVCSCALMCVVAATMKIAAGVLHNIWVLSVVCCVLSVLLYANTLQGLVYPGCR